jgi:hypothetical protein
MIQNILTSLAVGALGFVITLVAWMERRKGWDSFKYWWDVEGWPIFLFACVFLAIIATALGCFRLR